jgi:hemerythrin
LKGFEKDHVALVDLLHQLDTRIHENNITAVGQHAADVHRLLSQVRDLLLPHFQAEELALSKATLDDALTKQEQHDIEAKILKHVQASAQSNIRFAIMYYTLTEAERNAMFVNVPGFVTK